jgi:hypothetical protein
MKTAGIISGVLAGVVLGFAATVIWGAQIRPAEAGNSDRYEDYIMCTGAVAVQPRAPTDGVWLLDYKSGRLLGTVIDRSVGQIVGWAEVDLTAEFNIRPKQNVHFLMTTGNVAQGQAALYVAETTTGLFGIYTMGPDPSGKPGVVIRRHDMKSFRQRQAAAN